MSKSYINIEMLKNNYKNQLIKINNKMVQNNIYKKKNNSYNKKLWNMVLKQNK